MANQVISEKAPDGQYLQEEFRARAHLAAAAGAATPGPGAEPWLLAGLKEQEAFLESTVDYFRNGHGQETLSHAAEWMLDNFYLAQQSLRQIREDMPPASIGSCPSWPPAPYGAIRASTILRSSLWPKVMHAWIWNTCSTSSGSTRRSNRSRLASSGLCQSCCAGAFLRSWHRQPAKSPGWPLRSRNLAVRLGPPSRLCPARLPAMRSSRTVSPACAPSPTTTGVTSSRA